MMATNQTTRVFIYTGRVAHLLDSGQPRLPDEQAGAERAVCGTKPYWPGIWWGSQEGTSEKAAMLPLCSRCESLIKQENSGSGHRA